MVVRVVVVVLVLRVGDDQLVPRLGGEEDRGIWPLLLDLVVDALLFYQAALLDVLLLGRDLALGPEVVVLSLSLAGWLRSVPLLFSFDPLAIESLREAGAAKILEIVAFGVF